MHSGIKDRVLHLQVKMLVGMYFVEVKLSSNGKNHLTKQVLNNVINRITIREPSFTKQYNYTSCNLQDPVEFIWNV